MSVSQQGPARRSWTLSLHGNMWEDSSEEDYKPLNFTEAFLEIEVGDFCPGELVPDPDPNPEEVIDLGRRQCRFSWLGHYHMALTYFMLRLGSYWTPDNMM